MVGRLYEGVRGCAETAGTGLLCSAVCTIRVTLELRDKNVTLKGRREAGMLWVLLLIQVSEVRGDHGSVYVQKIERSAKSWPNNMKWHRCLEQKWKRGMRSSWRCGRISGVRQWE